MAILWYSVWLAWNHTIVWSFYDLDVAINFYGTFYDFIVFIDHHIWLSMIYLFLYGGKPGLIPAPIFCARTIDSANSDLCLTCWHLLWHICRYYRRHLWGKRHRRENALWGHQCGMRPVAEVCLSASPLFWFPQTSLLSTRLHGKLRVLPKQKPKKDTHWFVLWLWIPRAIWFLRRFSTIKFATIHRIIAKTPSRMIKIKST